MKKEIINISIVEDQEDIREFLIDILNAEEGFCFKQAYNTADEAVIFLKSSDVDMVIVDIRLPGKKNGTECVKQIKALRPDIEFMMYTIFDHDDNIFESLKAGASGYLLKTSDKKEVINAIKELASGGSPMSPSIARKVTDFFFNGKKENQSFKELKLLSSREIEVLKLLTKGLLYKEIADHLKIAEGTIKQHIHKIYKKLHVQNRTEAINVYLGRDQDG